MKSNNLMALVLITLSVFATPGFAEPGIPIEHYGADGDGVLRVSRSLLGEDFFTRDFTADLLEAENFTASFERPKHRAGGRLSLGLELTNRAEYANDIVVSVWTAAGPRNYLVRVEAGQTLGLDMVRGGLDRVDLLSLQAFSVAAEWRLAGRVVKSFEPAVRRGFDSAVMTKSGTVECEDATPYCTECSQAIEVCLDGGGCVIAYAVRTFDEVTANHIKFGVQINYPSSTVAYHCYDSLLIASGEPQCKSTAVHTYRCDGSGLWHRWDDIDDTLYNGNQSTAECIVGCSDTFTVDRL